MILQAFALFLVFAAVQVVLIFKFAAFATDSGKTSGSIVAGRGLALGTRTR